MIRDEFRQIWRLVLQDCEDSEIALKTGCAAMEAGPSIRSGDAVPMR
jgi:hypothetical protein